MFLGQRQISSYVLRIRDVTIKLVKMFKDFEPVLIDGEKYDS